MKGQRRKPRVECERGRIVKTSTEQRKKQKGDFNMNIVVDWTESVSEMRKKHCKTEKGRVSERTVEY